MTYLLTNGRIIDPTNGRDELADILIGDNGTIAQIGPRLDAPNAVIINCAGQTIAPGFIDMHVHLRVPGQEYKEDVASGTAAAANGGFTALACQPNTQPPIDNASIVQDIHRQAENMPARVYIIAAVSKGLLNTELSEMADLKDAGIVGIGDDAFPVASSQFMRRAMEYCAMLNLPFFAHCEDKDLTADGAMNEGYVSTVLGLKGIPRWAENIGTARNISLSMATQCRLHILHVSTAESVEIIRSAKSFGAPITCETCPQYFALTDDACLDYNTNAKMSPPLRTQADQDAIKAGLADGTIDTIATDHAPHAPHEKQQEFARAPFGMLGLETSLALCITHLVKPGILTLAQLIDKMSAAPARILGVSGGSLAIGAPADITVFDPDLEWNVDINKSKSKSRNSVLDGVLLTGKAITTLVAGKQITLP